VLWLSRQNEKQAFVGREKAERKKKKRKKKVVPGNRFDIPCLPKSQQAEEVEGKEEGKKEKGEVETTFMTVNSHIEATGGQEKCSKKGERETHVNINLFRW